MSLGPDGLLSVADLGNSRIEGFAITSQHSLVYARQFPLKSRVNTTTQQFAVAPDGRFYVGDGMGGGAVYDYFGTFLGTFSDPLATTPPPYFWNPLVHNLISIEPDGTVLIWSPNDATSMSMSRSSCPRADR